MADTGYPAWKPASNCRGRFPDRLLLVHECACSGRAGSVRVSSLRDGVNGWGGRGSQDFAMKSLEEMLTIHEGLRLYAYDDATGKALRPGDTLSGNLTIGIGRNLTSGGLTQREVSTLLKNDIQRATKKAKKYKWFDGLNDVRKAVIVSLIFNMGTIDSFKRMRAAIAVKDWETGSAELLDSRYARQVGDRALVLAGLLRSGSWL
tara:strand:+ start:582 stop:1196 length:615 start_codon:yes stop_codon:yes gene_type:complete